MDKWILSLITFIPLLGMFIVLCMPRDNHKLIRGVTVAITAVVLLLTLWLWRDFAANKHYLVDAASTITGDKAEISSDHFQYYVALPWIPEFSINYKMGVDGLSVCLIVLTGLLGLLATFSAFSITKGVKGFFALYLLLMTGMMGVFVSLDLFLFYVFWELMLLPMYFLIGLWGGPRREYAAIKFFLYTLAGSVLILLGMLAFYFKAPDHALCFDIPYLMSTQVFGSGSWMWLEKWIFWGFFIGFAIKVPVWPFHTWLPDAHVEAPTAISVILAGVLLKMGGYGILRINFPLLTTTATSSAVIMTLATLGFISIVYGAFCALAQTDFKKLVAYSSVSHMGYVLLGIASLQTDAINGAVFQMFNHGLSSAMMFLLVGVVYERAHHRDLRQFGGIALQMPNYFAISIVGFFAALGLPGLNGFISEAMVFLGAFKAVAIRPLVVASALGIVLTAAYILWAMQRVYMGKLKPEYAGFPDLTLREKITLYPLAIGCILFGVYPKLMIDVFAPATEVFVKVVQASAHAATMVAMK